MRAIHKTNILFELDALIISAELHGREIDHIEVTKSELDEIRRAVRECFTLYEISSPKKKKPIVERYKGIELRVRRVKDEA